MAILREYMFGENIQLALLKWAQISDLEESIIQADSQPLQCDHNDGYGISAVLMY